jgi:hypothetical protein
LKWRGLERHNSIPEVGDHSRAQANEVEATRSSQKSVGKLVGRPRWRVYQLRVYQLVYLTSLPAPLLVTFLVEAPFSYV